MLFSIVTTFYNSEEKYINKILDSILNQTYTRWEWIITDDFSTLNNCTENVKKLPNIDKRIKYYKQSSKKEVFWNPHKCANGDIVVYIDSDDFIYPKFLEFYYRIFLKFGDIYSIICESACYDETQNNMYLGNLHGDYSLKDNMSDSMGTWDAHNELLPMPHGRAWRNMNIDFTEGIPIDTVAIVNDFLMFTKLEEMGKMLHVPRTLHYYLSRSHSISRYIDENNNYITPNNALGDYIEKRRKNKQIKSLSRYYDPIYYESISFNISELHNEKICNDLSLITNGELENYKKELLQDLYFDHNLNFNEIKNNMDYYYILLRNEPNDFEFLKKTMDDIRHLKRKEILITILEKNPNQYEFFNSIKDYLSSIGYGYYWTCFRGKYFHIKF